jgi:DNA polymerase V
MAVHLGEQIWRDGYRYAKAGVMLTELQREVPSQLSLLQTVDVERRTKLWRTIDQVNREFGRESVRLLGSGLQRAWKVRADHRSPRWTTHWDGIPVVKL